MKTSKKKIILHGAIQLIVKNGFKETSMRDLANSLNMQPSSFYNHFKSKDEILETICEDVRVRFQRIRIDLSASNLDPKVKFHQFLRRYITEMLVDEDAFEIYVKYSNYSEKNRNAYYEGQVIFIKWVKDLLNEIKLQIKPKILDEHASVLMLIYSLNLIPKIIEKKDKQNVDAIVQDIYDVFIYGILPEPKN